MVSSRLTLLLLFASASLPFAVSANTSSNSLMICSAPSCLFRNGTQCDRTRQECPRCVLDDPLLGTPVCTAVETGRRCRSNFTLCPATPLETTVSTDVGYHPVPLTLNTAVPSPSSSGQRMITNNMPMAAEGMLSASESLTGKPTWKVIAIVVASVGVIGSLFIFVHVYRRQQQPKGMSRDSMTPLTPPPCRNEDTHNASFKTAASPLDDAPTFDTFVSPTMDPKRLNDPKQPTHPSTIHDKQASQSQAQAQVMKALSTRMSDLAISLGPDSYRRHTCISETALFMDSERSAASVDCWDVDDITLLEAEIRSRKVTATVDDDDVDIYPDTAITVVSDRGRMFSPKTRRANEPSNFTTFSVDDDEAVDEEETYRDTSVSATRSATGAGALEWDVVDDVWVSHREVSEDSKHALQQQQIAQWKAKYRL